MGWGVGEELTKSWPTFEQLCVQNLALAISCCFLLPRACTKSGWLEVDQELDMSWPTFATQISVLKLQGSFLQRSSGNTQDSTLLRFDSSLGFSLRNFWRFEARDSGTLKTLSSLISELMFATKEFQRREFLLQQHATRKSSLIFQNVPKNLVQKCKN